MISLTSPVETFWHRWPAGLKLAAMCAGTTVLFALDSVEVLGTACACVAALYLVCGRRFALTGLARLRVLWPFLALIALWHGVTGTPAAGAAIALRLLAAVALANLVTMTTRLSQMIAVIRWLATPLRRRGVTTRPLEIAIALVIRFTPELIARGRTLALAWRARSARRPGWRLLMPLSLAALDDADRVAEALRARGGVRGE